MSAIFISHSSRDNAVAEEIRAGDLVYFAVAREHLPGVLSLVGEFEENRRQVLDHLRAHGSTREAFTFRDAYTAPDALDAERATSDATSPAG